MLAAFMPDIAQLQLGSSDTEERRLLKKVVESVVKVGNAGGDKAEIDTQERIVGAKLDYRGDEEY